MNILDDVGSSELFRIGEVVKANSINCIAMLNVKSFEKTPHLQDSLLKEIVFFSNELPLSRSVEADVRDNSFVVSFIESADFNFLYDLIVVKGDLIHEFVVCFSKVLCLPSLLEVSELDLNTIHFIVTSRGVVFVRDHASNS